MEKQYDIITSKSASGLSAKVRDLAQIGWKPVGSHQVVTKHAQNRFAGTQHRDTTYEVEYSQTLIRE